MTLQKNHFNGDFTVKPVKQIPMTFNEYIKFITISHFFREIASNHQFCHGKLKNVTRKKCSQYKKFARVLVNYIHII